MEVSLIDSICELQQVEHYWTAIQHHPNVDLSQFRFVCSVRPEVIKPHVLVLMAGGRPVALLVARVERTTFSPALGYFAPLSTPATIVHVLYQGALGNVTRHEATVFLRHLWKVLYSGGADIVQFNHVVEHSPVIEALMAEAPTLWCPKNVQWTKHWSLDVPPKIGGLITRMNSKHRKWLRAKQREIERAFAGGLEWRWLTTFDSIPNLCLELEALAARTYQRGLGAGFRNDEETRRRLAIFAAQGQLRVQLLKVHGGIRAFWIGVIYGGVFYSSATAYDPQLREYELGNLVFHRMIDELTREGVTKLDFGLGDAFYKRRFGDSFWREATIMMFAPSAKGLLLRCGAGLLNAADRMGRVLLQLTDRTDWLKRRWRRHLSPPDAVTGCKGPEREKR